MLVVFHELTEALLCNSDGVSVEIVEEYDKTHPQAGGNEMDMKDAPYLDQHSKAMTIERLMCHFLNEDWADYNEEIYRLCTGEPKMEINRLDLIKSLEIAENALGDNTEPNEQSRLERQSFRFNDSMVYANNGTIAIETILSFDTGSQCCVHGKQLLDFLKSLSTETINADFGEKQLKISSGKIKANFNTSPYKEYETIINKFCKNPMTKEQIAKILYGLEVCKKFVHREKTQGVLCGVHIGKESIMASDRKRIARQFIGDSGIDCVLPLKFVDVLLQYGPEVYSMQLPNNTQELQAFFGDSVLATVIYGDKFPDFDKFFPADAIGSINVSFKDPGEFYKALNRHVAILADSDLADRDTKIAVSGNTLTFSTTSKSVGVIEETFDIISQDEKEVTFFVDPLLLKQTIEDGFFYYLESKLILFVNTTGFKCLLQTRRPIA